MLSEVIPTAIPLHRADGTIKAYALVDSDDYARVSGFRWYQLKGGYAVAAVEKGRGGRKEYLHRMILALVPGDGLEGDHVNRNRLDCRRSNLRVTTRAQNGQNLPGYHTTAAKWSRHRGVAWHKQAGKWEAYATLRGLRRRAGLYDDEDEAAEAARVLRAELMTHATD